MGVPVAVEDDYSVGRLQVEAQTTSSCAQEEDEVLGGRVVEGLQQHTTVLRLGGACGCRNAISPHQQQEDPGA